MSENLKIISKTIDDVKFGLELVTSHEMSILIVTAPFWSNRVVFNIQDVDLAQVTRAVANSENLYEFRQGIKNIWGEENLLKFLRGKIYDLY